MKNSSKNNYSEKNSKKNKKNTSFYSKNVNSSKKNDRFTKYSDKSFKSQNEVDKNKRNLLSQNRESLNKSKNKFSNKSSDIIKDFQIKKILMIGYGENILFLKPLLVRELLIGFGVQQKYILQKNFTFY